MKWLEGERRAAVSIHLDELASKMQNPAPIIRVNPPKETTDQGLLSYANFAQGTRTQRQGLASPTRGTGGIDVVTQQQALEVTEKREKRLEAKNLNVCPLCKKSHYYEKTWDNMTPPFKTQMMSTRLLSCPKFLLMTGEERLRAVTAQSACLFCSAWDHA